MSDVTPNLEGFGRCRSCGSSVPWKSEDIGVVDSDFIVPCPHCGSDVKVGGYGTATTTYAAAGTYAPGGAGGPGGVGTSRVVTVFPPAGDAAPDDEEP